MNDFLPASILALLFMLCPYLASPQTTTHSVSLSWSTVSGATGYNVYKNETGGCSGSPIFTKVTSTPITTTTFSENGLAAGVTRCYYITAVNSQSESTPSASIQITTPIITAAPQPTIVPPTTVGSSVT